MASLKLTAPENGKQYVFIINEGVTSLELNFDSANALFEKIDNNLLITLKDGSSILLENFYSIYSRVYLPEFVLEGTAITGADFLAALSDNLMPAAGSSDVATLNQSSHTKSYDFTLTPDINNENVVLDGLDSTDYLASTSRTFSLSSFTRDLNSASENLPELAEAPEAPQTSENLVYKTEIIEDGTTVTGSAYGDTISVSYMRGGNILAGGGYDTIVIGSLAKDFSGTIDGGDGIDTFAYGEGSASLFTRSNMGNILTLHDDGSLSIGTTKYDNIINFENLAGGNKDDTLRGNDSANTLMGGNGNDTLEGHKGNDTLYGGNGNDYLDGGKDWFADLPGSLINEEAWNEELNKNTGDDTLYGGDGDDKIWGRDGDDILVGGSGDDLLVGGLGSDLMTGGSGNDTFSFYSTNFENVTDTITDFGIGSDILDLTAYKQAGFNISFTQTSNTITVTDGDITHSIYLEGLNSEFAGQIQDQIDSDNFTGGIKII